MSRNYEIIMMWSQPNHPKKCHKKWKEFKKKGGGDERQKSKKAKIKNLERGSPDFHVFPKYNVGV